MEFLHSLNYNDQILKEKLKTKKQLQYYNEPYEETTFLSRILYYENLKK